MRPLRAVAIVAVVGCVAAILSGQTPASPAFEVASVKSNKSGSPESGVIAQGHQFTATNAPLRDVITVAFRTPWFRIMGSQPELGERFDIVARIPDGENYADAMLQHLLVERFGLRVHNETREQSVYALVVANRDKLGPNLKVSPIDCLKAARESGQWLPPCSPPRMAAGRYVASGIPIEVLANILSGSIDNRVVVDRTNLTGFYDVDLRWTPNPVTSSSPDSANPSIFAAVQEQLGLKLESTRGPVDVLVIDHVEHPTEN